MLTLGVETSCDETSAAVVSGGRLLSNVTTSSVHLHAEYGGVVPEIASRYHSEYIYDVAKSALLEAGKSIDEIELIAVTEGPGLCGSLLTGITFAKALGYALEIPVIPVNHIAAHLYANFITRSEDHVSPKFPFIGLIVSGGHTNVVLVKGVSEFQVLGQTQDDAVGEAFDKVAKILGLGYPGGPMIEKRAALAVDLKAVRFPKVYLDKEAFDFSFSGIKTAVLYFTRGKTLTDELINSICFAFQEAVFEVLTYKCVKAARQNGLDTIVVGGGVAANQRLIGKIRSAASKYKIRLFSPDKMLCLDNAGMIAALGEQLFAGGARGDTEFVASPNLSLF